MSGREGGKGGEGRERREKREGYVEEEEERELGGRGDVKGGEEDIGWGGGGGGSEGKRGGGGDVEGGEARYMYNGLTIFYLPPSLSLSQLHGSREASTGQAAWLPTRRSGHPALPSTHLWHF